VVWDFDHVIPRDKHEEDKKKKDEDDDKQEKEEEEVSLYSILLEVLNESNNL
jgi:hypothetical protein